MLWVLLNLLNSFNTLIVFVDWLEGYILLKTAVSANAEDLRWDILVFDMHGIFVESYVIWPKLYTT